MGDVRQIKFAQSVSISKEEEESVRASLPKLEIVKTKDQVMLDANERFKKLRNKKKREEPLKSHMSIDLNLIKLAA